MPKQIATVPLCAPVDSNFERIKATSVQKMPFCYVHREGGYRRLRYIYACRLILWKLINPMSREGPKLKSYMIISHCRSVLLLLITVNWCPLFL